MKNTEITLDDVLDFIENDKYIHSDASEIWDAIYRYLDKDDIVDDIVDDINDLFDDRVDDDYIIKFLKGLETSELRYLLDQAIGQDVFAGGIKLDTLEDEFKYKALKKIFETKDLSEIENFANSK
jgi:hypothetical protein